MKQGFFVVGRRANQSLPAFLKRPRIWRNDPRAPRHDTRAVVKKQFVHCGIRCPRAYRCWIKRRTPCRRAIHPCRVRQRNFVERHKLFVTMSVWQRTEVNIGGSVRLFRRRARGKRDANRLLHALKNASVHLGLMTFWRAIDDPNVVAGAAHVVAHFLKAGATKKARHGDEADDAGIVRGVVVKHFPRRPAPEINVEISQVFAVRADLPFARRHPCGERRTALVFGASALHPTATAFGFFCTADCR